MLDFESSKKVDACTSLVGSYRKSITQPLSLRKHNLNKLAQIYSTTQLYNQL